MNQLTRSFRIVLFALCAGVVFSTAVSAVEVRFHPSDTVYVYEERGEGSPRDLFTAVIQNLAVVNDADQPVTIQRIVIDAVAEDGSLRQSVVLGPEALDRSAQLMHRYAEAGMLELLDFQFQTSRYLKGVGIAPSRTLAPKQALVVSRQPFLFKGLPSKLIVRVEGVRVEGERVGTAAASEPIEASAELAVAEYRSKNEYSFPVRGRWMALGPSLHSHHRWGAIQEFALDLLQLGPGTQSHTEDGSRLAQYFAYGAPIHAAGDGVVVSASDGMEESDSNLKQPGEDAAAYEERMGAAQQQLMMQGFEKIMGNHVIIEHPGGEYSVYAHLKTGTVSVKKGDAVKRLQPIGALGHSGNSTEPHLHFHMLDGPDMAYSRSVPVNFIDVQPWPAGDGTLRHILSGQVVQTSD